MQLDFFNTDDQSAAEVNNEIDAFYQSEMKKYWERDELFRQDMYELLDEEIEKEIWREISINNGYEPMF